MLYLQNQYMYFKNLKDWKDYAWLVWNWFCLGEFCFQSAFLFNFDFQMHKTPLKSFVFEISFIEDNSSTFYLFVDKVWGAQRF